MDPCIFWTSRACPVWTHVSGQQLRTHPLFADLPTTCCMPPHSAALYNSTLVPSACPSAAAEALPCLLQHWTSL